MARLLRHRQTKGAETDKPYLLLPRQNNGFLEAINGLFQAAKRKARGYGTFSTIRTVVFLLAGKLDFSKINPHAA